MLKHIVVVLLALIATSHATDNTRITRSNYRASNCNANPSDLYRVETRGALCLAGDEYPFDKEIRLYSCSLTGHLSYKLCSASCTDCDTVLVEVATPACITWTTNDYSDVLTCGEELPKTLYNTPAISYYNGKDCSGTLQFGGVYGNGYCNNIGQTYGCNATTLFEYNCTASCTVCALTKEFTLNGYGESCIGYERYRCINASLSMESPTPLPSTTVPPAMPVTPEDTVNATPNVIGTSTENTTSTTATRVTGWYYTTSLTNTANHYRVSVVALAVMALVYCVSV